MDRFGKAPVVVLAAVAAASILGLVTSCGIRQAAEKGAERGAQKEIGRRLDSAAGALYGGGMMGTEADAYKANLSFEVQATRVGESAKVDLKGTVRNSGARTVTYLKVRFVFLDKDRVQVASRTDLLAHGLTLGDNNSPVDANSAKRFISAVDNVPSDWTPGAVTCVIEEIAIK